MKVWSGCYVCFEQKTNSTLLNTGEMGDTYLCWSYEPYKLLKTAISCNVIIACCYKLPRRQLNEYHVTAKYTFLLILFNQLLSGDLLLL